uniref:Heme response regulator HssR n=1 Tax=uncultured bacterium Contig12 TaxID=1393397 RepID=W0FPI7_9BACT|nr:DNA-binding response regulator VicR [uncultured bacterium Contig12]
MFNILVVEDARELRELFCDVLKENGYHAIPASDGREALEQMVHNSVDLIISDIMMPQMDGYELIRSLRDANELTPVLMITAKGDANDKRKGFQAGTDDYMVKPVDVNEMIWRVEALLRRSRMISQRKTVIGQTTFDCDALTVQRGTEKTELPQKEFLLMYKLISSPNRIFTRQQIMDDIWGPDSESDIHTLEVHISRLRERFRDNPDFELVTVRGLGYKAVKKE